MWELFSTATSQEPQAAHHWHPRLTRSSLVDRRPHTNRSHQPLYPTWCTPGLTRPSSPTYLSLADNTIVATDQPSLPHPVSNMSAPDARPPTNWSRGLAKITALNRFARAEDAGIRPGEDAHELTARRLHSAAKRTASPNAAHSSPGGVPDRLKRLQRGPDPQPPRKGSSSSDYSASSNASYGSNGSGGSSSSSTGPIPRRTSDHRVLPYRLNDPARTSNLQRSPMVVLDSADSEPPSCSQFSNYWNESPQLRPISGTDRALTVVESVISSSVASDATAMTGYTLPDPGPDRLYL